MKLLTKDIRDRLLRNGRITAALAAEGKACADFKAVVKLFTPDVDYACLLTELDPEEPDIAFGFCDLGMGCPELGSARISELESVRAKLGLPSATAISRRRTSSRPTRERRGTPPRLPRTRKPSLRRSSHSRTQA